MSAGAPGRTKATKSEQLSSISGRVEKRLTTIHMRSVLQHILLLMLLWMMTWNMTLVVHSGQRTFVSHDGY